MNDYYMHLTKLPLSVKACATLNEDGSYSIFVNDYYPQEVQRNAVEHELQHIKLGHLEDKEKTASEKEYEVTRNPVL